MAQGWQGSVYVKDSRIHGLGVFARRNFSEGETVLVREERPVTAEQPLDEARGEYQHHCDWLEGGRQVYLGFPERHFNHSCDANTFARLTPGGVREVVALRPVTRDEELTSNYSIDLWDGKAWECNCGSQRCLGLVPGDFFSLPLERQADLRRFLSQWFIDEHAQEYEAFCERAGLS